MTSSVATLLLRNLRAKEFFAYLREREAVRLNKESGRPRPWTADPILQKYKFTNVRREHDRISRAFFDIYQDYSPGQPREQVLLNCALYRYFGTAQFAQEVGWLTSPNRHLIRTAVKRLRKKGIPVFTGSYIVTNAGRTGDKVEVVCDFIQSLWRWAPQICDIVESEGCWQPVHEELMNVDGFGGSGFMAKEAVLDTMYCPGFWWGHDQKPFDYHSWTPLGPGGMRGALRVAGDNVPRVGPKNKQWTTQEAARTVISRLTSAQGRYWPATYGKLSPHDIQFGLCEFEKYERVRLGEGFPRGRYPGEAE